MENFSFLKSNFFLQKNPDQLYQILGTVCVEKRFNLSPPCCPKDPKMKGSKKILDFLQK
jgi:hypothetical protein